jgi:hypothetical protein
MVAGPWLCHPKRKARLGPSKRKFDESSIGSPWFNIQNFPQSYHVMLQKHNVSFESGNLRPAPASGSISAQ